jgi:hypothetical protein
MKIIIIGGNKTMNNKEKLQEIKESWISEGHLVKIDREHFEWLIKQAEIVVQAEEAAKQALEGEE